MLLPGNGCMLLTLPFHQNPLSDLGPLFPSSQNFPVCKNLTINYLLAYFTLFYVGFINIQSKLVINIKEKCRARLI